MLFNFRSRVLTLLLASLAFASNGFAWQGIEIVPPPPITGAGMEVLYTDREPPQATVVEAPYVADEFEGRSMAVDVNLWHSDVAGDVDSMGMSLDLGDDTDIGSQNRVGISGRWQFSELTQLQLDYFQFNHSGYLNRAVTFDSLNYAAGSSVRVRNNLFGLGLAQTVSEYETGGLRVLCGARFSQLNTRLEQKFAAGTRVGELDQNIGMPYLGLEGATRLSANAGLTGSFKYFDLDRNGEPNRLSDFDFAFVFGRDYAAAPAQREWYGMLGYRHFMLNDASDGSTSRIVYSGPVFGIRGRF
ncbi:MAG: hypothetical protein CVV42_07735 [Candidatus Riflebacteria bacterium HGW-Riflebacteria-2]|nr:MAG: hypothetical protein CVV42_07735 [Candidatus Riflebacteria bacterium HGW-Riflebacteria-2]